jgi:L-asparagine transporter-like permease
MLVSFFVVAVVVVIVTAVAVIMIIVEEEEQQQCQFQFHSLQNYKWFTAHGVSRGLLMKTYGVFIYQ